MSEYQEVRTTQHNDGQNQRVTTFRVTQIIWLLLGLLEAGLGLRFIFKLIAVNGSNAFATLVYGLTGIFVAPFASLVGAPSAEGMVLEISTIIAMLVYLLIAWGLERIVYVLFYRPRGSYTTSQTIVADRTLPPVPVDTTQTTVTERTNTQTPPRL